MALSDLTNTTVHQVKRTKKRLLDGTEKTCTQIAVRKQFQLSFNNDEEKVAFTAKLDRAKVSGCKTNTALMTHILNWYLAHDSIQHSETSDNNLTQSHKPSPSVIKIISFASHCPDISNIMCRCLTLNMLQCLRCTILLCLSESNARF